MMSIFVILGLLVCVDAEVTPVFVQTGKDLLLDVKEAVTLGEDDQITWSVNETKSIARFPTHGTSIVKSYSERAEYFALNHSLLLKNVEQSDRGDYRARVSGDANTDVAEYKVTVLDPVSPVKLTVNSCSSDSSHLTVTCSTQDSLISRTFTCDDQTCSDERGERAEFTTPGASLNVYLQNNSIICVHKNEVSRTEDVIKIEAFCKKDPGPLSYFNNISVCTVKIIVISSGLVIMVCAVISVHIIENVKKRK
ncbi:CD48 antigen-like isoform X2 [Notolabrus celidotus]|uniref:CD48 antigen-like isoform X2 n=1 Tax=Notolabrus celidotus TaxID=1203425 RepID=UPI00148FE48D|nr:CD48 antigen-like isoform X2 [Notolabrus celidotus]